ncbi:MAG: 16S rRNA (cytosine(967)-C(5))-methyltransferase RsmB [Gammaproteobacteria bacterium]|nr:16S rRNA (cytosine(967)-C(5))-methyltransferase RsmB [Gammaproteobacteria bacterium]
MAWCSVVNRSNKTARSVAAQVIATVIARRASLDGAFAARQDDLADSRERAFAREIASGTVRWFFRLNTMLTQLSERPPRDQLVTAVVLSGLYQLGYMRVPEHAAIDASVETVRLLGKPRAAGFVNAVLRRYQREKQQIDAEADRRPNSKFAYPRWLLQALREDWPDRHEALLRAGNERAPMWVRVDTRHVTVSDYAEKLDALGEQPGVRHPLVTTAVRPGTPVAVSQLPGFGEGLVSVQDAGAQLAAPLLDVADGMRVLDACAAPGGKSLHLLQTADIELVAVDNDAGRLARIEENFERAGVSARLVHADAASAGWWDGKAFDRILLDVPCSATGVIRRHPDIKLLRRPGDIAQLVSVQQALLARSWSLLAPGGVLLYSTCSILRRENEAVVSAFADETETARVDEIAADWGVVAGPGRQILPGEAGMDGFYYSRLQRIG